MAIQQNIMREHPEQQLPVTLFLAHKELLAIAAMKSGVEYESQFKGNPQYFERLRSLLADFCVLRERAGASIVRSAGFVLHFACANHKSSAARRMNGDRLRVMLSTLTLALC